MKASHSLGNEEGDLELVVMFTGVHYRENQSVSKYPQDKAGHQRLTSVTWTQNLSFRGLPIHQSPAQSRAQPTILTHGKTEGT